MADITATNVTVTIDPVYRDLGAGALKKRMVAAQVAFGDGVLTYPTNGVPLPAIGQFNMVKALEFVFIQEPVDLLDYRYDATNHTIRIYEESSGVRAELSGGVATPAATTLKTLMLGE